MRHSVVMQIGILASGLGSLLRICWSSILLPCASLCFKDFIGFSVAVLSSDIQLNGIDAVANCLYQVLFGAQELSASLVPLGSSACFLVGGRAA